MTSLTHGAGKVDPYEVGRAYPFLSNGKWVKLRYLGGPAGDSSSWEELIEHHTPESLPPTFRESVGQGMSDITDGMMQAKLMATNPDHAREFTATVNAERDDFEARGGSKMFGRAVGNVMATLPAALIPGGGQSLLARLALGGVAGGLAGGAQFAPSGTALEKVQQVGVGAGTGAVVPEAARVALRPVAATGRAVTGASRQPAPGALARQADFDKLQVRPTSAQVTRVPEQFAEEMNYAQVPEVGSPIRAVREAQSPILAQRLDEVVQAPSQTPVAAGRQIQDALGTRRTRSGIFGRMTDEGNDLFDAARAAPGNSDVLDYSTLMAKVAGTMDEFEGAVPAAVRRRLARYSRPDAPEFTVKEAFKLRDLINNLNPRNGTPETVALGRLTSQLDEFLDASSMGGDAIGLFRQARAAWAKRGDAFSAAPMLQTVDERLAPDDFVRRAILGGKVDDVARLKTTLIEEGADTGSQAWEAARRQVVEHLESVALNDAGAFSATKYNRALAQLGEEKLAILFGREEREMLETIGRAATNLFTDPASGGIPVGNRSGTAAAAMDMMSGSAGPLGRLLGPLLKHVRGNQAVQRALGGSPVPPQSPFNIRVANFLVNPGGRSPLAAGAGAIAAGTGR